MRNRKHIPELCSILLKNGFQFLVSPTGEIIGSIKKVVTTDDETNAPAVAIIELHVNLIENMDIFNSDLNKKTNPV